MAVAFVQGRGLLQTSATFVTPTVAGNRLIGFAWDNAPVAQFQGDSGVVQFTKLAEFDTGSDRLSIWEYINCPAGLTVFDCAGAALYGIYVAEYSGIPNTSEAYDIQYGTGSGQTSQLTSPLNPTVESMGVGCSAWASGNGGSPVAVAPWLAAGGATNSSRAIQGARNIIDGNIVVGDPLQYNVTRTANQQWFEIGALINLVPLVFPPTIVGPIPNQQADEGAFFTVNITAYFGGATSYTSNGTMPPGISLDGSSGVISGYGSAAGVYTPNIVGVNIDGVTGNNPVQITIVAVVPVWSTIPPQETLLNGVVSFNVAPFATGTGNTYTLQAPLPAGLSLAANGVITGTVTTIELAHPVIRATNAGGFTDSAAFDWNVISAYTKPHLTLPGSASGAETLGPQSYDLTSYNVGVFATSWSTSGGPPGSAISNAGVYTVNWTTNEGTWYVSITANGGTGSDTNVVQFIISSSDPKIVTAPPTPRFNTVGDSPSINMGVYISGATSWTATGMPPGSTINVGTGLITGTLSTQGTYNPVVTGINTHGQVQVTWQWVVQPVPPPEAGRYGRV